MVKHKVVVSSGHSQGKWTPGGHCSHTGTGFMLRIESETETYGNFQFWKKVENLYGKKLSG